MKKTGKWAWMLGVLLTLSLTATVWAADSEPILPNSVQTIGGSGASMAEGSVFGSPDDFVYYPFPNRNDSTKVEFYNAFHWNDVAEAKNAIAANPNGFVVFDADVVPPEDMRRIGIYTSGTAQASPLLTSGWQVGVWNRVRVVYDYGTGSAKFYINGQLAQDFQTYGTKFNTADIRYCFVCTEGTPAIYGANPSLTVCDEDPGAGTYLAPDGFELDGQNVKVTQGATRVGDVTAVGGDVRIYGNGDAAFASPKSADSTVQYGDVIVICEKASRHISVFHAVYDGVVYLADDTNGTAFGEDGAAAQGYAGKAAGDVSFLTQSGASAQASTQGAEFPNFTVAANFAPGADLESVALYGGGTELASVTQGWRQGQWNRAEFIYDSAEAQVRCYINGTETGEPAAVSGGVPGTLEIRFAKSGQEDLGLDDFSVLNCQDAVTPTEPVAVTEIPRIGGILFTGDAMRPEDSRLAVQGAQLTAYTDGSFETAAPADTPLCNGSVLVYESENRVYTYYIAANKNMDVGAGAQMDLSYDNTTAQLQVTGKLSGPGRVQLYLTRAGQDNPSVAELIASAPDGAVAYTVALGEPLLGPGYQCRLVCGTREFVYQISTVKPETLAGLTTAVNGAADAQAMEAALRGAVQEAGMDDGLSKDYAFMAELILAMKPTGGYSGNGFLDAYMLAEGLCGIQEGRSDLKQFLMNYRVYMEQDYNALYDALSASTQNEMEEIFRAGLEPMASFDAIYQSAVWMAGYRLAGNTISTQRLFEEYAKNHTVSLNRFNQIKSYRYREKVYEKLYQNRKKVYNGSQLVADFNQAVEDILKEENKSGGGNNSGGGGSSSSGGGGGGYSAGNRNPGALTGGLGAGGFADLTQPEPVQPLLPVLSDIQGHWAESYINTLVNQGVINGFGDGTFRPDTDVTRAEFAKMVYVLLKLDGTYTSQYTDVDPGSWYYAPVSALTQIGIIQGTEDGRFLADEKISRQDMAVMADRAAAYASGRSAQADGAGEDYTDWAQVAEYARAAVASLTQQGILTGDQGRFYPENHATRAEAAALLVRTADVFGIK